MSKNELTAKEKRMIESVKENPFNFRRYKEEDQFEELACVAVKAICQNYHFIRKDLLSDSFIDKLIKLNGYVIGELREGQRTLERYLMAIESRPSVFQYIPKVHLTDELIRKALQRDGTLICYLEDLGGQKEEYCWLALNQNPASIKEIFRPTCEMWEFVLKQNGSLIQYIENPTQELCMIALEQTSDAVKYISL